MFVKRRYLGYGPRMVIHVWDQLSGIHHRTGGFWPEIRGIVNVAWVTGEIQLSQRGR